MLGLGLGQGTPLDEGAGSLPRGRRRHLGDAQGLRVCLSSTITGLLRPLSHGTRILCPRVQLSVLLGRSRAFFRAWRIRVRILAQGIIQ